MITDNELEATIGDVARDISQVYPDPEDWEGWALYFFEAMEQAAIENRHKDQFEMLLRIMGMTVGHPSSLNILTPPK